MKYNDYSSVTARGELGARCALLSSRLEAPIYRPDVIYGIESAGWPGDWEGRTILALTCLSDVTKREPSYLDEIISLLPSHLNGRGYLGPIYDGYLNEQQLSGHSWLLRGLCEYFKYRKYEYVLPLIDGIVRGLYLPAAGKYASYPTLPEQRAEGGGMSGNNAGTVGIWMISTDTGCAYMPLDGLTQAYEILREHMPDSRRDEALASLIDEMISEFFRIPFLEIRMQTHATLSGCRGALRRYAQTGDEDLLASVRRVFNLYEEHGMTPTYANDNWFKRPEWTEPCAIIDSYMVASQLFALTEDPHYGELSLLILKNGVLHAQRPNGGFGCDSCAVDGTLSMHCYEAYWCCTMRGGEGLAAAVSYAVTEDGVIVDPVSCECTVRGKRLKITSRGCESDVEYEGGGRLYLFVPHWYASVKCEHVAGCDEHYVYIDVPQSGRTHISVTYRLWDNGRSVLDGPFILASEKGAVKSAADDVSKTKEGYDARGNKLITLDKTYLLSEAAFASQSLFVDLI